MYKCNVSTPLSDEPFVGLKHGQELGWHRRSRLSDEPFVGLKHLRKYQGYDNYRLSDEPFVGLKHKKFKREKD